MSQADYIKVYDELADAIFGYCYLKVSDRERAKDILQRTFTLVWEHVRGSSIPNIRDFLFKTADNLIGEYIRQKAVIFNPRAALGHPTHKKHQIKIKKH